MLSRTHPGYLARLFETEIPEIQEGIVVVKAAAREAGERAKVAVASTRRDVDPIGACVGLRGTRIQVISRELRGEKIDIIEWSHDLATFVARALSPAKVTSVTIAEAAHPEGQPSALVIVADNQLSLAIGKKGQNARLAAKLTGMRIDIKSESELEAEGAEPGQTSNEDRAALLGLPIPPSWRMRWSSRAWPPRTRSSTRAASDFAKCRTSVRDARESIPPPRSGWLARQAWSPRSPVGRSRGVSSPRRDGAGADVSRLSDSWPQEGLVRLVRRAKGEVTVDPSGRAGGRGAYVCPDTACPARSLERGRLAHAFKKPCAVRANPAWGGEGAVAAAK